VGALGLAFAAVGIVLTRSMMGAGDSVATMILTLVSLWGVQVPLAIVLSKLPSAGETGVWWAGVAASAFHASTTGAYFAWGRWKRKKVL